MTTNVHEKRLSQFMAYSAAMSLVLTVALIYDLGRTSAPAASGESPTTAVPGAGPQSGTGDGIANPNAAGPSISDNRAGGTTSLPDERRGVTGESIKIGSIFTETGPFDGRPAENALRALIQTVNESGGVHGRKITLAVCDDGYDATRGVQCAKRLVQQDKVFAIAGWLAPASEAQALPYFIQQGVPVVGGGIPQDFGPKTVFPNNFNQSRMGPGIAPTVCATGAKKIVMVIVDIPHAGAWIDTMQKGLEEKCGFRAIRTDEVSAATPDYSSYVVQWRASGADSILAVLDPMSLGRLFQALKRQAWEPKLVTINAPTANAEHLAAGIIPPEGTIDFESHLWPLAHPGHPGAERFLGALRRYYPGTPINPLMELPWSGGELFIEGLRRAGPDPTRAKLIAGLNTLDDFVTDLTPPVTFTANDHDAFRCIEVLRWSNDRWVLHKPQWQCWNYTAKSARAAPSRPYQ
ncbi:MAG: ABC transporter substrate-binding protein [Actinomycetota bacterium]